MPFLIHSVNSSYFAICHLGNILCSVTYDRGGPYLHMKLHFCAEQLGVQSHQLSVSVMEVALNTTGADEEELSRNIS